MSKFQKGNIPCILGRHNSESTRLKMSLAKKGKYTPIGAFKKGHKISNEIKLKMSEVHKGKRHTEETKNKIGSSQRGEKSHLWKGGRTKLYMLIRNSSKYRKWRTDIFTRDNYTCILCKNNKGGNLNADHFPITFKQILNFENIKTLQEALDCKLLWDTNNGRTLCKNCHKKTDTYLGLNRWKK